MPSSLKVLVLGIWPDHILRPLPYCRYKSCPQGVNGIEIRGSEQILVRSFSTVKVEVVGGATVEDGEDGEDLREDIFQKIISSYQINIFIFARVVQLQTFHLFNDFFIKLAFVSRLKNRKLCTR